MQLPKTLEREPLVDAVFEVRLSDTVPLADILPGYLFHQLKPRPEIKRLPAAEIPLPMRASDPNMQCTPVMRLDWSQYYISFGDRAISISCKMPYPKWAAFKATTLEILNHLSHVEIPGKVERYSVKYVNIIEAATVAEQLSKINLQIKYGPVEVAERDNVNLQVQRHDGDVIQILEAVTNAQAKRTGETSRSGVLVSIDSIRNVSGVDFRSLANNIEPGLEELRQTNKQMFFGCLTEKTIEELGPVYE
ncbi:TIGR04255 family protein [Roseibium sp. RP-7]